MQVLDTIVIIYVIKNLSHVITIFNGLKYVQQRIAIESMQDELIGKRSHKERISYVFHSDQLRIVFILSMIKK